MRDEVPAGNSSNQHKQTIPGTVERDPAAPPEGGARGTASAAGDAAEGNVLETELNGRTVAVQEDSGAVFADLDANSVTAVSDSADDGDPDHDVHGKVA